MLDIPAATWATVAAMVIGLIVAVWQAARKRAERTQDERIKLETEASDAMAAGDVQRFELAVQRLQDWRRRHGE